MLVIGARGLARERGRSGLPGVDHHSHYYYYSSGLIFATRVPESTQTSALSTIDPTLAVTLERGMSRA